MPDQYGEKSQEPTPFRRQKAREEGHVARSHELTSAAILVGGVLALGLFATSLFSWTVDLTKTYLGTLASPLGDVDSWVGLTRELLAQMAQVLLPLLTLAVAAGVAVDLAQMGLLIVPKRVAFDLSRIDPIQGFRRIFSWSGVIRLLVGLAKVAIIFAIGIVVIWNELTTILNLSALELPEILQFAATFLYRLSAWAALAILVLGIVDYGLQRWRYELDLRMTPQEVREELKHLEGDPQIIARRRAIQRQLVLHRLSAAVPKADVVITNPTEYAVALKYEPQTMIAPVVVAKGAGLLAQRIRILAIQHGIPIVERRELAQALYRQVDVNRPIPRELYAAVAEVLAYVYKLKGKTIPRTAA
ncbi:MAG: flagellar biosynthesis protein FlhB [Thermoguttaceae bacterium]|nr:flagellar biosynthesis protein FlhB [Thermoguttaceae bacterium]MDW8079299.1 flagellar biosynthesis protein FlhB [Thermoguttaceae bacterium]